MTQPDFSAILAAHFPETSLDSSERLTGGVSADVFRLDLSYPDGSVQPVVLRVHGQTHGGHNAELEFALLKSLHEMGLPVPQPLYLDASGARIGDPYLVIDFVNGESGVPQGLGENCVVPMARMLARIHQQPPSGTPELPVRTNPLPEVFDFLPEGEEWQAVEQILRQQQDTDYQGKHCLLHGDFWPENILWQGDEIAAVLDWEDAALGDPLSDLASARVELRYLFGRDVMDRFSAVYALVSEIDPHRLALWQIYVAAAADRYMDDWGLAADRVAHMHREARASIREAAAYLESPTSDRLP